MPRSGRPRVLDDVKRGQVTALITFGCGLEAAARYVGCSVTTVRREILRSGAFKQEVRGAEAKMQLEPLRAMRAAAATHWRAAAWLLERTNPSRFGRRGAESYGPEDFDRAIVATIETATDVIKDESLRKTVCRNLLAAAREESRVRQTGESTGPLTEDEKQLQELFDGIERDRRQAVRRLAKSDAGRQILARSRQKSPTNAPPSSATTPSFTVPPSDAA